MERARKTPKPRSSTPKSPDARPRRRATKAAAPTESIAPTITQPTRDDIARRAYEISQQRHGQPGDPLSDWLQAERELTADTI